MKKICFFSGDITRCGGTERVAAMIAGELSRQKQYQVCFLSLCEQGRQPFFEIASEIERFRLGEKWLRPGPGYLPLAPKLRAFLKAQQIDAVIDIDIVLDALSVPAAWGLSTKVLSWEHAGCAYELSVPYRKYILKCATARTDYVVTLTEGDREAYGRLAGRRERIRAIPNPMKRRAEDTGTGQRENWILSVGRLAPEKGIDFLLQVAVQVLEKHRDWKWVILGEGEERQLIERTLQREKLASRLIAPGLVRDVDSYLSRAKLFVLTSRREGLPMCLLEAKEHSLPCVSFDIATGPGEMIEDGVNGYLIKPFDCDAMAAKVNLLIEQEERRERFAECAQQHMEKFEMQNVMAAWNEVLREVCG